MEFMQVGFLCDPAVQESVKEYMRILRKYSIQSTGVTISDAWKSSKNGDLLRAVQSCTHIILLPKETAVTDWMIYLFGYASGKDVPLAVVADIALCDAFAHVATLSTDDVENYVISERSKWQYQHRIEIAKTRLRGKDRDADAAYQAALAGDLETVEDYIAVGMSMDARTTGGVPILVGAVRSGSESVVQRVLAEGADPNASCGSGGESALCEAASRGYGTIVGILLSHNADPNQLTANGQSALMLAASQGKADIVAHLISAGADPIPTDSLGMTAVDYARLFDKRDVLEALSVKS